MKPDRSRSLAGRLRRVDPHAPKDDSTEEVQDPFAEIKYAVQIAAVRELGQALLEGEVPEETLREAVQIAVDEALAEAGTPLSSADHQRLVREISENILGYGPIEPFLADETISEVMVNNHRTIYVERQGPDRGDGRPLRVGAPPAAGDRPHRRPDRAPDRRVEPDGRRPPARRLARQRHHPAAGHHRPVADDPQVLQGPADDGRPGLVRHPVAPGGGVPRVPACPAS